MSCGPQVPANYASHEEAAESATARRDHVGAAAQWAKAADVAENETDRQEALYRQATSALRAGDTAEHQRLLQELANTPGPRSERAVFDLASAQFARDPQSGRAALKRAILAHPASGLARGALEQWLQPLPSSERIASLNELLGQVDEPQLRERILFLTAKAHEAAGNTDLALQIYEQQVREYPYPRGQFWDESLLRQGVLWLNEGNVSRVTKILDGMLSFRERATVVGSYDRHYADATLLLAYVFVDDDWERAHRLLSEFPSHHAESRNRDDALWAAMLLASAHGRSNWACDDAKALVSGFGDSRYAPCVAVYCPEARVAGVCKSYITEKRRSARSTLEATLSGILATPR